MQRVGVRDVPVENLDSASPQLAHHCRIEINDHDLAHELLRLLYIALMLELVEDGARVAEEAQKDDRVALHLLSGRAAAGVQVFETNRLEQTGQEVLNRVA